MGSLYSPYDTGIRTGFLSLNNAAFLLYVAPYAAKVYPDSFWIFSLGFGSVLLLLSGIAARFLKDDPFTDAAYLAQGLLLVTIAIVTKLAGYQLALVLAVESAILIARCRERHDWLWQIAAGFCAAASLGIALDVIFHDPSKTLLLGGASGLIFLFNARWVKHLTRTESAFNGRAAYYCGFALLLGAVIIWDQTTGRCLMETAEDLCTASPWFGLSLAMAAALLTFTLFLHGLIELAVLAQIYVLAALGLWLVSSDKALSPWWDPAIILALTLAVVHRWSKSSQRSASLEGVYALGIVALIDSWLPSLFPQHSRILACATLAASLLFYGKTTNFPALALFGQWFAITCGISFFSGFEDGTPAWLSLASIGIIAGLGLVVPGMIPENKRRAGPAVALAYRLLAFTMFLSWGFNTIAPQHRFLFFMFPGLLLFILALLTNNVSRLIFSGILALTGLGVFWFGNAPCAPWSNLAAIVLLLSSQQLAKKSNPARPGLAGAFQEPGRPYSNALQQTVIVVGLSTLWLLTSRWATILEISPTIAWSAIAAFIFAIGLGIRERLYRLSGLAILGCTLGRIFLVDVWQLGTLTRIASFIVLGFVLLLVGFLYNRLADKFRDWL